MNATEIEQHFPGEHRKTYQAHDTEEDNQGELVQQQHVEEEHGGGSVQQPSIKEVDAGEESEEELVQQQQKFEEERVPHAGRGLPTVQSPRKALHKRQGPFPDGNGVRERGYFLVHENIRSQTLKIRWCMHSKIRTLTEFKRRSSITIGCQVLMIQRSALSLGLKIMKENLGSLYLPLPPQPRLLPPQPSWGTYVRTWGNIRINGKVIVLLQGPLGTGKTTFATVVVEISEIYNISYQAGGASNVGTDTIASKIFKGRYILAAVYARRPHSRQKAALTPYLETQKPAAATTASNTTANSNTNGSEVLLTNNGGERLESLEQSLSTKLLAEVKAQGAEMAEDFEKYHHVRPNTNPEVAAPTLNVQDIIEMRELSRALTVKIRLQGVAPSHVSSREAAVDAEILTRAGDDGHDDRVAYGRACQFLGQLFYHKELEIDGQATLAPRPYANHHARILLLQMGPTRKPAVGPCPKLCYRKPSLQIWSPKYLQYAGVVDPMDTQTDSEQGTVAAEVSVAHIKAHLAQLLNTNMRAEMAKDMETHREIQDDVKAQKAEFTQDLEDYRIIQDDVEAQRAEMAEDMETYRRMEDNVKT
ncbi:MAG: hypothetical protein Q9226_001842 [Calogaya cf. arnoldii]